MDFDDAYANMAHIPDAESFVSVWTRDASLFRAGWPGQQSDLAYGDDQRHRLDLFYPETKPKGLVIFFHGGYWRAFAKEDWSHLATGPLGNGYAVAMPSYRLAPDVGLDEIARDAAAAVTMAADLIAGPVYLCGHSAGGHLVTRLVCGARLLPPKVLERIAGVTSISGVHDLRPLRFTAMNAVLQITERLADSESPALLLPCPALRDGTVRLSLWVGANERPEFCRQTDLLGLIWGGLGVPVKVTHQPSRHHFDVIDGLRDRQGGLIDAVLGR